MLVSPAAPDDQGHALECSVGSRQIIVSTVDIGILTIRDDEFRAVLAAFPEEAGVHHGRREYTLRLADAGRGERYVVAILRQVEQGNGEAQDAARDLLDDLDPSLLLVVGIAGGLPSDEVTLGDVVLSTRINDYSVEARKTRAKPTYHLSGGPIAKKLAASVANLPGRERDLGAWASELPTRPRVTWSTGRLYGPKRWQRLVKANLESHFGKGAPGRVPTFHAGAIASSDRLVKDPAVLFPWIQTARHLLAVEMESGGVYRAARDRCPMLAIRGISDLVGLERAPAWTRYACASAAAFARAYLRTRPAPLRSTACTSTEVAGAPTRKQAIYSNLVPVVEYPSIIHVAPATCSGYKHAWALLLQGTSNEHVPRAWALHDGNIYSFGDPADSRLDRIVDGGAVEAHPSTIWAGTDDADQQRLFVQILNGALEDDLRPKGIRFFADDKIFAFAGRLDEPPRTYRYQNLRQRSAMTVVAHYTSEARDGQSYPFLRHLAFAGRFRRLDGAWFLEVTPTYRFTTDGRKKYRFHEERLSGIKRLERNRAVLSQVLLWNHLLAEPVSSSYLRFGPSLTFEVDEQPGEGSLLVSNERAHESGEHGLTGGEATPP